MADSFEAKSICILGRQPALGLAELECLFGAGHIMPVENAALLDIPAEEINFQRLGGTVKVARCLAAVESASWRDLSEFLINHVPEHLKHLPAGKFTFGISTYNLAVSADDINKTALKLKKIIKRTGRPVRSVPNRQPDLNSAQVLHNKLTYKGGWELIYIRCGSKTLLAQTIFVQDIDAYAARDQARPARDARVGMLPPKLAQILVNLAAGQIDTKAKNLSQIRVLDPFCGTGVILQEALLMGYSVLGTDIDRRMVEYSKSNLQWLFRKFPALQAGVEIEQADATSYQWPGFSMLASEAYLGRPLSILPPQDKLQPIISDTNTVIKKFLRNLKPQIAPGHNICIAVPAWRKPDGLLINLPLIDQITDMGYNYRDLKHVRREELVYYRENQIVARQIVRIRKA